METIMGSSTAHQPNHKITLLCARGRQAFVGELNGIYEHSPWIADKAWDQQPFANIDDLHLALMSVVQNASKDEQLGLICAHPELAGKEAEEGSLTTASTFEQQGAGLNQCSRDELQQLRTLNAQYRSKFGFPCVIAVKGLTRYQIMDSIQARLANSQETEFRDCLEQIYKIAKFRLDALFE
jgi:2-oxo-4-hydroxy-4-carboxy-5-ureidoimidazoline decarboxylase